MKAGIIAAGLGLRLSRGGVTTPKPLVPIRGVPLISRIIHGAAAIGADSVACVVNGLDPSVNRYLAETVWPVPLQVVTRTTGNSMESLFELVPVLDGGPFTLFTVDTVFSITALLRFTAACSRFPQAGGVLALTRYIDDERPLLVDTAADRHVTAIGDPASQSGYATAGFYYFRPGLFEYQAAALERGIDSLRRFLAFLVERGYPMYGVRVSKTIDVDRPEDIRAAEEYAREHG